MTSRSAVTAVALLLATGAVPAAAAEDVKPLAGATLVGAIEFPRAQRMTIETGGGSRLTVRMGFHARCSGRLAEAWASDVPAAPTVRVRRGRFDARLRATVRDIGGVPGRSARFTWRLRGRFLAPDVVRATVSGSAVIRGNKHGVLARCKIARPTAVRLTTS